MWLHPTHLNSPVDIMIKPGHTKEVEMELEEIGLIAKVFIDDVGKYVFNVITLFKTKYNLQI